MGQDSESPKSKPGGEELPPFVSTPFDQPLPRPFPRAVYESGITQAPFVPAIGIQNSTSGPDTPLALRLADREAAVVQGPTGPTGPTAPSPVGLNGPTGPVPPPSGNFAVRGNEAELRVSPPSKVEISKIILGNRTAVQIAAFSLLAGLDARIEQIDTLRLNSEPREDLENLRALVVQFLEALAEKSAAPIADATLSIKEGLKRWWTKDHDSICGKTLNLALFGSGLSFLALGGVLVVPTALTVGVLVGGPVVADAIKAYADILTKDD